MIRDRDKARKVLPPFGPGSKVQVVQGDLFADGFAAELLAGATACINLIGIIRERRGVAAGRSATFRKAHVESTRTLVSACEAGGVRRYLQMSALGVSPNGVSDYQKTKFEGEQIVRRSTLDWTIIRPGLIHGPDGEFMQMMKKMIVGDAAPWLFVPYFTRGVEDKRVPLGPVIQHDPVVQPVAVEDVAAAFAAAIETPASIGEVYNLVGGEALDWPAMIRVMRDRLEAGNIEPFGIPADVAANAAKFGGQLGFASVLPFDEGMARMGAQDATADLNKVREELNIEPRGFHASFAAYAAAM
jgi:NADH dehydrogenase